MTQGSTVRAFSALSSVYAFNGSAVGTITHLAGLRICFPDNPGSAVNITNNYALLINNQTTGTGTVTYTNRWGIYQEGASDLNYLNANLLLGSTTNNGNKLQVTGNGNLTGDMTADAYYLNGMTAGNGALYWASDRVTLANYNTNGVLHFEVNGGAFAALFNALGNLGIGTSSPAARLTVEGASTVIGQTNVSARFSDNFNSTLLISHPASTSATATITGNEQLGFATGSVGSIAERMRITSGGNVLIGTTTDAGQKLQVNGSGFFGNSVEVNLNQNALTRVALVNNSTATGAYVETTLQVGASGAGGAFGKFGPTTTTYKTITGNTTYVYNNSIGGDIALLNDNGSGKITMAVVSGIAQWTLTSGGNIEQTGSIKTGAPTTGTAAAWKLGSRVAATVVVNTTEYIEVDIGGTLYKLATVT
jgi:hypothetical protein